MLTCHICGYTHLTMISPSHLKTHHITGAEYKAKFPGSVLRIQTADSLAKIAASKCGSIPWNAGKKIGPNIKLSETLKGKPRPNRKGEVRTAEQRKNISTATKAAMVNKMTDEVKKKLSDAIVTKKLNGTYVPPMLGKKVSDDTKEKIKQSLKKTNTYKSGLIIDKFINLALQEDIKVNSVEDNYWFNMHCNKCNADFTFSRQIFRNSTKAGQMICPCCYPRDISRSKAEIELFEFVKSSFEGKVISNDRDQLAGKELDVLIPELKLAIEFTGLYWHSEKQNDEKHHLLWKMQFAQKRGIRVVTVFEDEWLLKKDIVKSRILGLLGKHDSKLAARKLIIKDVSFSDASKFLDENHIQGKDISQIRLGLYDSHELVQLATFKKTNMSKGGSGKEWELSRLCSKLRIRVRGGGGKLISYFQKYYNEDKLPLISYADRRWSVGEFYEKLGFKFHGASTPSYWYTPNYKTRMHRSNLMKHKLVKCDEDKNLTEWELAKREGYDRIWDCGTTKWIYSSI